MDSDDDNDVFRHDDDSGDEYLGESDSFNSESEIGCVESHDDRLSSSNSETVDARGDNSDSASGSKRGGRGTGRGTAETQWVWETLNASETNNPKEWLMNFDEKVGNYSIWYAIILFQGDNLG